MKTIFIAPVEQKVGLSSVSLGMVRALQRASLKVGFCKPIAQDSVGIDRSVYFAEKICKISVPSSIPLERAEALLGREEEDTLMEEVVGIYREALEGNDVVVVEGITLTSKNPYAHHLNTVMARTLNATVILLSSAAGGDLDHLADSVELALRDYDVPAKRFAGLIVNFVPYGRAKEEIVEKLNLHHLDLPEEKLLGVIGQNSELTQPRTLDIANFLNARILYPGELATRRVKVNMVTARTVSHFVDLLKPGTLVVTPGDREDVIMATSLAVLNGIPLAGLLLTSGFMPSDQIQRLCNPALNSGIPVMMVDTNSYITATHLDQIDNQVPLDDFDRMENVLEFVADQLEIEPLQSRLGESTERVLSPPAFRYELIQKSKAAAKTIVLPEGDEPRTVRAAVICHEKGIAKCILLANPRSVKAVADAQELVLPDDLRIIDPEKVRQNYIAPMVELRKHKGLTAPMAEQQLEDNVVLGTMMLAIGEVDGLVSGAVHTTANTVRPALQLIKTAPEASLVSSIFFMLMPDQVLVYGDCAINPDPNAEELADIAIQSADSAASFGITPRVAMISYSTGTSGAGADVEKVSKAVEIARIKRPDLLIDGPLQYDAASVESVGKQKAPDSQVAGRATVFVFPDLNTGNTTYKAVQRSAGVISVGPMLQGLRKPVNDLSRGALVDDIVYTIALTAIQAK